VNVLCRGPPFHVSTPHRQGFVPPLRIGAVCGDQDRGGVMTFRNAPDHVNRCPCLLQLLHAGNITYTLNAHALSYLQEERLPKEPLRRLQRQTSATIAGVACWEAHLDALGIERHRRIATEGALLGGLIEKGFALDLAIISGGTRSDLGKRCRDGFASLKKTCRKLGISFWDYLGDRIGRHGHIAPLPDIIRERAAAASTVP